MVTALTADASASNKLRIVLPSLAIAGTTNAGKWVNRLIQQKTNYVNAIAKGFIDLDFINIEENQLIYKEATFVEWSHPAPANVAAAIVMSFSIQALQPNGVSANTLITTTSAVTRVEFLPVANIAVLDPAELARLATKRDVINANIAF